MVNFKIDVIHQFRETAKTKEKLLAGLKLLKQQGIDPLDSNESHVHSLLAKHVFRVLIADSPTQSEKEYLKQIWNSFNLEGKHSLLIYCIETTFGRSLLESIVDDKLLFETIMNRGILAELTGFIKNKPDFFKTHDEVKIFQHPLRKILLCEEAGLKINFNILINTVYDNFKVKVPSKLFNFIKRHKDKVTPDEWDQVIIKFLENVKRTNYSSAWDKNESFIGDAFTLVEELNSPKEFKVEELIHLCSYFSSCDNIDLLDVKNKKLSLDEINNRWLNCVVGLNTEGLIKSDLWDKLYHLFDRNLVAQCIKKSVPVIKKYDEHHDYNTSSYPLGTKYLKLMSDETFKPMLLDLIFEHGSVQTNKKVYNREKSNIDTVQREYMYRYYIHKLLDNPQKATDIHTIMGNDLNDDRFKKIHQVISMERAFPENKKDSLKIKL